MTPERARELVARRRELERKLDDLVNEYTDVLTPPGVEANRWRRFADFPHHTDEQKTQAVIDLDDFDESIYNGYMPKAWILVAEFAPMVTDDLWGCTWGSVQPPEQSVHLDTGILLRAAGMLI